MLLYHYRSVKNALLEIENGTLHFSAREDLNDPLEGYVRVFWQGDKAAWEGLFRNYICSLSQARDIYLVQGDEDTLRKKSLLVDLHRFDDLPLGSKLKELGEQFLNNEKVRSTAEFYGGHAYRVQEKELKWILLQIHGEAMQILIRYYWDTKFVLRAEAESILQGFPGEDNSTFSDNQKLLEGVDPSVRECFFGQAAAIVEDMHDFYYLQLGLEEDGFLYSSQKNGKKETIRTKRKWLSVAVDFPNLYIEQLKAMLYPESFIVCFSGMNNDSSMWGTYADNHRGVCLIYETDEENCLHVKGGQAYNMEAKPVIYGGERIERNFFETFGRLTYNQVRDWLTGTEGLSSCMESFSDRDVWRNRYWEVDSAKTYRKMKEWEHECEYRIAYSNFLGTMDSEENRNLKIDPKQLKGIIFGMHTAEQDRKRLFEKLLLNAGNYAHIKFYQAEYDEERQSISVREKTIWSLRRSS